MKIVLRFLPVILAVLAVGCDNFQVPNLSNMMSKDATWDDSTREALRESLRDIVLGEVRFSKNDHDDIIQFCREVYIQDESPEDEWDMFVHFAKEELEMAAEKHSEDQLTWPLETDSDRLDLVEAALRDRGILLWQASPCCDTCTGSELGIRIDEIDRQHPGFRDRVRGYAFFIDQNMADMLAENTNVSVYLAYGWFSPDDSDVAPEVYKKNALGIANEVCECLREHGFEPDWEGDFSKKIGVALNWQRRTMLQ